MLHRVRQSSMQPARHDVIEYFARASTIEQRHRHLSNLPKRNCLPASSTCKRTLRFQSKLEFSNTTVKMVKDDQTVIEQVPHVSRRSSSANRDLLQRIQRARQHDSRRAGDLAQGRAIRRRRLEQRGRIRRDNRT